MRAPNLNSRVAVGDIVITTSRVVREVHSIKADRWLDEHGEWSPLSEIAAIRTSRGADVPPLEFGHLPRLDLSLDTDRGEFTAYRKKD